MGAGAREQLPCANGFKRAWFGLDDTWGGGGCRGERERKKRDSACTVCHFLLNKQQLKFCCSHYTHPVSRMSPYWKHCGLGSRDVDREVVLLPIACWRSGTSRAALCGTRDRATNEHFTGSKLLCNTMSASPNKQTKISLIPKGTIMPHNILWFFAVLFLNLSSFSREWQLNHCKKIAWADAAEYFFCYGMLKIRCLGDLFRMHKTNPLYVCLRVSVYIDIFVQYIKKCALFLFYCQIIKFAFGSYISLLVQLFK